VIAFFYQPTIRKENPMSQSANFSNHSKSPVLISTCLRVVFFICLLVTAGTLVAAQPKAPKAPQAQGANKPSPKKKYRLRITKGDMTSISLKADEARMSDIATELSKALGTRVILGPSMNKQMLTVEFYDLLLEPGLRLIAPHVYIDYEVRADAEPKMLGIFLMTEEDSPPAVNAVVEAGSEAFLVEGSTEDTADSVESTTDDDPLHVELDGNLLTIRSKKQPLAAVLLTIADVMGVPAEIKYESKEIVDTSLKDIPFEDAIVRLSPNARVYVRADLTRSQKTPLRLALVPPPVPKAPDSAMSQ
jgi:hypothetical protein